ncbi:MAG: class I SAM-dependent methyltransferase [Saprospirales bacterium]|nr:class I SAM-dependent methyltransferase [Saprospirales bacterium]
MNWYDQYILPYIIHLVCQTEYAGQKRARVVPMASGEVLEIGIGSGLNLPYYDEKKVHRVVGIDPSSRLWRMQPEHTKNLPFPVEFIQASAEAIPLEDQSVDTVLTTFTLCSIPDLPKALEEISRVLKPSGRFIFFEHGKAPDHSVQHWQNSINPVWKRVSGGCNLNRDIPGLLEANGFAFETLDEQYDSGWKPASYHYWGIAKKK